MNRQLASSSLRNSCDYLEPNKLSEAVGKFVLWRFNDAPTWLNCNVLTAVDFDNGLVELQLPAGNSGLARLCDVCFVAIASDNADLLAQGER